MIEIIERTNISKNNSDTDHKFAQLAQSNDRIAEVQCATRGSTEPNSQNVCSRLHSENCQNQKLVHLSHTPFCCCFPCPICNW